MTFIEFWLLEPTSFISVRHTVKSIEEEIVFYLAKVKK